MDNFNCPSHLLFEDVEMIHKLSTYSNKWIEKCWIKVLSLNMLITLNHLFYTLTYFSSTQKEEKTSICTSKYFLLMGPPHSRLELIQHIFSNNRIFLGKRMEILEAKHLTTWMISMMMTSSHILQYWDSEKTSLCRW